MAGNTLKLLDNGSLIMMYTDIRVSFRILAEGGQNKV